LVNGNTYYYTVAAANSGGTSGPSNEEFATPIPSAPTGLTASPGDTQVVLTWNASSGATSYNVYRGTSPGGESATAITSGLTISGYTDSGLTDGTTYYYTVKAVDGGGSSPASNEASATPAPSAAPVVSGGTINVAQNVSLSYQIVATGSPTLYGATGLPSGLSVNTATGIISERLLP